MIYSQSTLIDLGWRDRDSGEVIANIDGMDNITDGQRFYHAGKTGYPDVYAVSIIDTDLSCLCTSDTLPTGYTQKTRQEFVTIIENCGWGSGVYIGIDGAPHREGDEMAELPDVSADNTKIIIDAQRLDNLALLRSTIEAMADGAEKSALQAILTILEEDTTNG